MSTSFLDYFSKQDLQFMLGKTSHFAHDLDGSKILLTGGTGFFGKWILGLLLSIESQCRINFEIIIPTRHPTAFTQIYPQIASHKNVHLFQADIKNLSAIQTNDFTHILHAATDTIVRSHAEDEQRFESIIQGTQQVLQCISQHTKSVLYISSGAVYAPSSTLTPETANLTQDKTNHYAMGKLRAEREALEYCRTRNINLKIARPFAFVGPFLPLRAHFAIGNFIADVLEQKTLTVQSDGTSVRSYLYAADMAIWLMTICCFGRAFEVYNVGSDQPISIKDLSQKVSDILTANQSPQILGQSNAQRNSHYIPNISKAKNDLKLDIWTPLDEAILRTAQWAQQK